MRERRHDLEYLAAGYLTGALLHSGHIVDDLVIDTDEQGVVTGELQFAFAGAWFSVTPTLIPAGGGKACRGCGCTNDRSCEGGCWWAEPGLCSTCKAAGRG